MNRVHHLRGFRTVHVPFLALVVALSISGCSVSTDTGVKEQNDRLPDVTLASLTGGKSLKLSTVRGPMVINLWASWCTPCRKELPQYQAFAEKNAGKVDVLGIDFQETRPAAARQLARETGVQYPLFSDPDGDLRAVGLPKLILVDPQGRVTHEAYVEITSVAQLERLVETHLKVTS
jgi:cytochrome c biogenesis protein CcmG/thiol:disulfide interchange protein DsbE